MTTTKRKPVSAELAYITRLHKVARAEQAVIRSARTLRRAWRRDDMIPYRLAERFNRAVDRLDKLQPTRRPTRRTP